MAVVIGGIYQHYKGKKYKIVGVAKHSETLEKHVVYQALYGKNELWIRPYEMFCETILIEDKKIARFKYVGDELDKIYRIDLEIPEDIKIGLWQNGIDIEKELRKEIENLEIEYNESENDSYKKDAALVIFAVGISLSAVILCVSKLIRVVNERPREVNVYEKDAEGNIIKEETILLEPHKVPQKTEIDFVVGTQNIKLRITDESN